MIVTINKCFICELFVVNPRLVYNSEYCSWKKAYSKGQEISYFFPRLWRPKYYDQDYYYNVFSFDDTMYTKKEMNKYIREHLDFNKYLLYEENDNIYQYPYVHVKLVNGSAYKKHFRTIKECENFISELKKVNQDLIDLIV